jgi:hypothetical protein
MGVVFEDGVGHRNPTTGVGGVATGTGVTPTLGAFSSTWGSSATSITGNDNAGQVLFTAGATPAAGSVVTVTFANAYPAAPRAVLVQGQATDQSAGPLFDATAITAQGFTISAAAGATKSYVVKYFVIP